MHRIGGVVTDTVLVISCQKGVVLSNCGQCLLVMYCVVSNKGNISFVV